MAQDIVLNGIALEDVPALKVPKDGGGYAMFTDVSDTTAAAADVASGKYFYTDAGVRTAGTASGGGGTFTPKMGIIRPDATLVKSFTYDKLLHQDLNITIPAYSTSNNTLVTGSQLEAYNPDNLNDYDYVITARTLTYPVYNTSGRASAYQDFHVNSGFWEMIKIDSGDITIGGVSIATRSISRAGTWGSGRTVYWDSASSVISADVAYGPYQTVATAPSFNITSGKITVTAPNVVIRGNPAYMNSTAWGNMTDIRAQYIFEVWKIPKDKSVYGSSFGSQIYGVLNDVMNNNRTLR